MFVFPQTPLSFPPSWAVAEVSLSHFLLYS